MTTIALLKISAENSTAQTFTFDGYTVDYSVTNSWGNTEVVSLTLTNTGSETIEDWMLYFDPHGSVQYATDATIITADNGISYFKNNGYNANIESNKSVTFSYTVDNEESIPDNYVFCQTRVNKTEGYDVTLTVNQEWDNSFNGTIKIKNNTDKPIEMWELSIDTNFTIEEITNSWAATVTELDNYKYKLKGTYTSYIASNSYVELGFIGKKNGDPEISNYSLNEITLNEEILLNQVRFQDDAFYECRNISNLIIPQNLKIIGMSAFYNCQNIKNIIIPESVNEIRAYAFNMCWFQNSGTLTFKRRSDINSYDENLFYNDPNVTIYIPLESEVEYKNKFSRSSKKEIIVTGGDI